MSKNVYRFKGNFKSFLFALALIITFGFLYYTQLLVQDLQEQSREFQNLKLGLFEQNINNDEIGDINFFFREIIQKADYPIIVTDANKNPHSWTNIGIENTRRLGANSDTLALIKSYITEFEQVNPPIPISYAGSVLGYCYYGESSIIRKLRWLPYIEILVVGMFILIGYAGFNSIKKSEEQSIWVGMAKETAHQLGTPLSSQMGWLEYLKSAPDETERVIPELEKDLYRLQIITNRFSQIGSLPDMKPENLRDVLGESVQYFKKRIPQKNGNTKILSEQSEDVTVIQMNRDLFSWVIENLVKNALDAMENKGGTINISSGKLNDNEVYIDVSDSGKGINSKTRKDVFKPGFSTKKRGWGLGLSLAKRIVEDYHGGKIFLKESQPGVGSTFRIILNSNGSIG